MKARRTILLAVGALMLAGATLGAGVALGSSRNGAPPKDATATGTASVKGKPAKCKANACVHWNSTGTMLGAHPGVVDVLHPTDGQYCVELSSKFAASGQTMVQATIDFDNGTPGTANIVEIYTNNSPCGTNGIAVDTFNGDGTWSYSDAAVFFTLP